MRRPHLPWTALAAVILTLPLAGQALELPELDVIAGRPCRLPGDPRWLWSVVEPNAGGLHMEPDGRLFYTAPAVVSPTTFHLRAQDPAGPGREGTMPVRVTPRLEAGQGPAAPPSGPNAKEDAVPPPAMTLYAGSDHEPSPMEPRAFRNIGGIGFIQDDPAMGALNRQWLVADASGVQVVSPLGLRTRLAGVSGQISALAVRPEHSAPDHPLHVVLAETLRAPIPADHPEAEIPPSTGRLWCLEANGAPRLLDATESSPQNGPREAARFGHITGLAMAPDGTLFVADHGRSMLRAISPDGQVRAVAGPFHILRDLTRDPATGALFVSDGHAILRVTPEGQVSTLLGVQDQPGYESLPAGQAVPAGRPCLNHPRGLACHGGYLYIADEFNHAIRRFNLETRVLTTLAGAPGQRLQRLGPLPHGSPDLPPEALAALAWPEQVAVNSDGTCLVALANGLARVDLPEGSAASH